MVEFLTLIPPEEALKHLIDHLGTNAIDEMIPTEDASGRVIQESIYAPHPLPIFPRTTVDGYAVKAADTYGASESLPGYLSLIGEIPMGKSSGLSIQKGACALIHTGGMLPDGADAVIMIEYTQLSRPGEIEVLRPVANGENVIKVGEDIQKGELILNPGIQLGPAEIGGLMALGITKVRVAKQPSVAILSSGDEIIDPEREMQPGQIRDINSYTLKALVQQAGGQPNLYGIIPDNPSAFEHAARQALEENDIVVFTAGSSVSTRDFTAQTIQALGGPGVLVHGVSIRPGKPTILAVCGGKPVIGLPGNPVSALVIAGLFLVPVIWHKLGLEKQNIVATLKAELTTNLSSQAGREDWVPVRLHRSSEGWLAEPVFGKSNLIFSLVRADGMIRIPPAANGLPAHARVDVYPLTPQIFS